jgi:mannosyltransferase
LAQNGEAQLHLSSNRVHWVEFAAMAGIVALGAVLRFHASGEKSVWVDEGVSIELARLDWYNFLRILWRHEGNMALYHLVLRFWLHGGSSEAWIRALSALFALATLPAVYALGRLLFNARTGLIASLLLAVNAYHVRYSQEARSYSLYPLLCVLSCYYFVNYLEEPSTRNRLGHVVNSALAVYAHFFSGLLIVAQWLSLRWCRREELQNTTRKNWLIFAVAIAPEVLFVLTTGTGVLRWIPRPGLTDLSYLGLFLTGNGGVVLAGVYFAAVVLAVARRNLFSRPKQIGHAWACQFLLIWLLFPILFVFAISQLKPFFLPRYFVFTLPALALLAATGVERLRKWWLITIVLAVFALLSIKGVAAYYERDIDIAREDWRDATRYVIGHAQPGDAILFHQPIGRMPYEYYTSVIAHANEPAVLYPEHGHKLTFRDFYAGRASDAFLSSVPAAHSRLWIVFTYNEINSGPDPTTKFITDLFAHRYSATQVQQFAGIEVRLYSR